MAGVLLPQRFSFSSVVLKEADEPAAGRVHLVVRAELTTTTSDSREAGDVRFSMSRFSERILPTAIGRDERGLVGLFSNLASGSYTLRTEGDRWRSSEGRIELASESRFREIVVPLRSKPSIHVELEIDPSLSKKSRTVSLLECAGWDGEEEHAPDSEDCHATTRKTTGNAAEFPWLEPLPYLLEVAIDDHLKRVAIDARGDDDVTLKVSMKRTRIRGRVLQNGLGMASTLVFQGNPKITPEGESTPAPRIVGRSAATGEFDVSLWPDVYAAAVSVDGEERPASAFRLSVEEQEDQEKDFVISANTVVVTLMDGATSRGVPGRLLVTGVLTLDENGPPILPTDPDGRVRLPSVHSGRLHLIAMAPGFVRTTAAFNVVDTDREQAFEIQMDRERGGSDFRVVLPDGTPAAGVEGFFRYDSESGMRLRIPCDNQGICHPEGALADSERVGLFHPAAALTMFTGRQIREDGVAVLRPSGGRLEIRVEAASLHPAESGLHAIVRFDGIALGTYLPGIFIAGEPRAFGARPKPMWFEGLPAGPMTVEIRAIEFDDQRRSVGRIVAGPFVVTLPSEPVTVRLQ